MGKVQGRLLQKIQDGSLNVTPVIILIFETLLCSSV
jgi:hypothetical protein